MVPKRITRVTEDEVRYALSGLLPAHPTADRVIRALWCETMSAVPETPEAEGERLYAEGCGLSDLWGRVSGAGMAEFGRVLAAFEGAANNPELLAKRAQALRDQQAI